MEQQYAGIPVPYGTLRIALPPSPGRGPATNRRDRRQHDDTRGKGVGCRSFIPGAGSPTAADRRAHRRLPRYGRPHAFRWCSAGRPVLVVAPVRGRQLTVDEANLLALFSFQHWVFQHRI